MGASKKSVKLAIKRKVEFLTVPDVNRWYENVRRGSKITAEIHRRNLAMFLRTAHLDSPSDLLNMGEKELRDLILDFVTGEEKRGVAGSTTVTRLKAVKSWLSFNGTKVDWPVKVNAAQDTPTLNDERVPTQDELRAILLAASPRTRTAVALMAFSGVRPEVLGNFLGDDGLRIGDLPDLSFKGKRITFTQVPARVVVRSELAKTHRKYFSFISEEGADYIANYLTQRMTEGEKLTPESSVVHTEVTMAVPKAFIRTSNIGDAIRKAIRAAGYKWRPYALRCFFDTQLLLAESKGKVTHDYRVFWMGHKGSMDARYTTNKGCLPEDLVVDMREAYHRCEPFLSTIPVKGGTEDVLAQVRREMLIGLGHSESELAKADLSDPKVFQELVKAGRQAADRPPEEVVDNADVPARLASHWTFVAPFNGSTAIMKRPESQ